MSIIYRSNQPMTNPPANAPVAPGRASMRATFSSGDLDDIVGTQTATWEGLDIGTWEGKADVLQVRSGSVVPVDGASGYVGLPVLGQGGAHVTWLVRQVPTSGVVYLDLFRAITGSTDAYRALLSTSGVRIQVVVGGATTVLSPYFPVVDGQTVGIRWLGGVLSLFVDGVAKVHSPAAEVAPGNTTGVAVSTTGTGWALDNVEIDVY